MTLGRVCHNFISGATKKVTSAADNDDAPLTTIGKRDYILDGNKPNDVYMLFDEDMEGTVELILKATHDGKSLLFKSCIRCGFLCLFLFNYAMSVPRAIKKP